MTPLVLVRSLLLRLSIFLVLVELNLKSVVTDHGVETWTFKFNGMYDGITSKGKTITGVPKGSVGLVDSGKFNGALSLSPDMESYVNYGQITETLCFRTLTKE